MDIKLLREFFSDPNAVEGEYIIDNKGIIIGCTFYCGNDRVSIECVKEEDTTITTLIYLYSDDEDNEYNAILHDTKPNKILKKTFDIDFIPSDVNMEHIGQFFVPAGTTPITEEQALYFLSYLQNRGVNIDYPLNIEVENLVKDFNNLERG